MAKNSFLDWDTTASNNTDIGGTGILGTNAVNNFDDALRTLMAQLRSGVDGKMVYTAKSGNYTAVANDNNATLRFTATATLSLTAAATLAANWHLTVIADGADVTIDPNASETINGQATLSVPDGFSAQIICDGSNFFTAIKPTGPELIGVYKPSAAASVDITNLSAYRLLVAEGVLTNSTPGNIGYRTSTNNGSSYDSGATDYTYQTLVGAGATAAAGATTASAGIISLQPAATSCKFTLSIDNFNTASFLLATSTNYTLITGGQASEIVGSQRSQGTARNAIRFFGSGTISGRINLWGMR
jgi:hypothetical protein